MGCGKSTMGGDSPNKHDKDEDWMLESGEAQPLQKTPSPPNANSTTAKPQGLPFNHGGPLLAQAKISGSQLDFFKSLDEKIESGPDYNSEQEEEDDQLIKRSRLKLCSDQWTQLTQGKAKSKRCHDADAIPLIRSALNSPSPPVLGEAHEESDSDAAPSSRQTVKEQYVFMGSLYTLTRLSSDGSYVPRVDVSPAHRGAHELDTIAWNEDVEENGGTDALQEGTSVSSKANGTLPKMVEKHDNSPSTTSTFALESNAGERSPVRPVSLALRTVFPNVEGPP